MIHRLRDRAMLLFPRLARSLAIIACACAPAACGQLASSPYRTPSESDRNSLKAQELTQKAAGFIDTDPQQAEQLLREALAADLFHGPAHNDLGVVHLNHGRWYEAAGEFEWARKLMPGHPDPRMNLALTLEKAGRIDEALCTYESALEVYPGHIPTMQALTRLQLRHSRANDRTRSMLQEISLAGTDAVWRSWAERQLALRNVDAN